MEIGINLNEKNQVIVVFDDSINGEARVEISDEVFDNIFNKSIPYLFQGEELVIDENKQFYDIKFNQIVELKKKLSDTDYIVTKTMEYQITGKPIPQEYNQIMVDRDSWREQINTFQNEMEEL
ncbi:MAG: hypothetical protein CVV28_02170 [Methanobacteriales archaeon HGW-Methanobacteriales-1]|jgi:hypothetical protein|nr:MAG: hypothetical protein CVV28_02170 [Methanobacteriales archaeon HGW-Methanobacteriales-1]